MSKSTLNHEPRHFAVVGNFRHPDKLIHAAETIRDRGYSKWDIFTPYPIHGLDVAMGEKRSWIPRVTLIFAVIGGTLGMLFMWWTSAVDYRLIIGGKPFFSWQAFIPVMFELTVLFGCIATVVALFLVNRIPQFYHPIDRDKDAGRITNDTFVVMIESSDPRFRREDVVALLTSLDAEDVRDLYDEEAQ